MDLDWYCTAMLKVRHLCRCGLLWTFSLLKRQTSPRQYVWFHTFNIQAKQGYNCQFRNCAKIFNLRKCWTVTIQLLLNETLLISACYCYCQLFITRLLFVQCFLFDSVFIWCSAFSSIWFFCSVFKLFSVCSILILEMYSRYFGPVKHQSSSSQ